MSIVSIVLASLVAVEFFYISYLESIATKSDRTRKVFNINKEDQENETVVTLFKNQGIYNGLLGVLILIAVFYLHNIVVTGLLMGYIILVAVYGTKKEKEIRFSKINYCNGLDHGNYYFTYE